MRVGVVQMTSTDDLPSNLDAAEQRVREAVERGAEFVALPEMFPYLRLEGSAFPHAQAVEGEIIGRVGALARALRVWIRKALKSRAVGARRARRHHHRHALVRPRRRRDSGAEQCGRQ